VITPVWTITRPSRSPGLPIVSMVMPQPSRQVGAGRRRRRGGGGSG
jgi:hypothetical protein